MARMVKLEAQNGPLWVNVEHVIYVGTPADKEGRVILGCAILTMTMGQYLLSEIPEVVMAKINGDEQPEKPILSLVN